MNNVEEVTNNGKRILREMIGERTPYTWSQRQRIVDKAQHHVRHSDGRVYAAMQHGGKVRSYDMGGYFPDGSPRHMATQGGVTLVRMRHA